VSEARVNTRRFCLATDDVTSAPAGYKRAPEQRDQLFRLQEAALSVFVCVCELLLRLYVHPF